MFACKFSSVLMKFLVSYTLQGARNAPNRVTMPRASDPNRCRRAELVPESPPRAARRAASARGPAPNTPAADPAAATPAPVVPGGEGALPFPPPEGCAVMAAVRRRVDAGRVSSTRRRVPKGGGSKT